MVKNSSFISFAVLKIAIFGFQCLEISCYLFWLLAACTRCSSFNNDGTTGYYFRIEWMYGQCQQGVPSLVMTAQGVTIFVLSGCVGKKSWPEKRFEKSLPVKLYVVEVFSNFIV